MKTWKTKSGYQIIQILSGRSNVFLLTNGKANILIDTSPKRKWGQLNRNIKSLDIDHLDFLLLTHTHYDHASNSYMVKSFYNAKVVVHQKEEYFIKNGSNKFPQGTNLFTRLLISQLGNRISSKFNFEPCKPDILIDSIFYLKETGFNAYLIHTPGHSAGSMSLIVDDEIAIVGDAMFGVFKHSIYPPFADNPEEMINSWGKLLETGCKIFLPAHGTENCRYIVQNEYDKKKHYHPIGFQKS